MSAPKLRLLKVIVQPVFVVDDGSSLVERHAEPVVVSPEDWPSYATTSFQDAVEKLQTELESAGGASEDPS